MARKSALRQFPFSNRPKQQSKATQREGAKVRQATPKTNRRVRRNRSQSKIKAPPVPGNNRQRRGIKGTRLGNHHAHSCAVDRSVGENGARPRDMAISINSSPISLSLRDYVVVR